MSRDAYKIAYGPALIAKDQPHRTCDTARELSENVDFDTIAVGTVDVLGHVETHELTDMLNIQHIQLDSATIG